jgi:hypothetical protein
MGIVCAKAQVGVRLASVQINMPLKDCPAEILYLVFKLLLTPEHYALCLVTKNFRIIAEPLLHSDVEFIWPKNLTY